MTWIAGTGGSITIDPVDGSSTVVTFATSGGATPTAYTNAARTVTASLPDTIVSRKTYYFAEDWELTVSAKISGVEVLGQLHQVNNGTGVTLAVASSQKTDRAAYDSLGTADQLVRSLRVVNNAGAAQTLDASVAVTHDLTLTAANCVITLAGATAGKATLITTIDRQDATGGRTITHAGTVRDLAGNSFDASQQISLTANAQTFVNYFSDDGGASWIAWSSLDPGLAEIAVQRLWHLTTARLETAPRASISNALTFAKQRVQFVFIDAPWDAAAPVSTLGLATGSTGTPSALTLCRLGWYTRDSSDNLTLVAFTASFHASMAVSTDFNVALASGTTVSGVTCPATVTWTRGQKLALAYIWDGTTHPVIQAGFSFGAQNLRAPVAAMQWSGQTELPASAPFASLAAASTGIPWLAAGA